MSETKPMTATHTPTPWAIGRLERQIVREVPDLCDSADCYILAEARFHGLLPLEEARANATFIVEAVNSHEAIKEQVAWWEEQGRQHVTRIEALESELASCRECRANLDCLSRGAVHPFDADVSDGGAALARALSVPVRDDGAARSSEPEPAMWQWRHRDAHAGAPWSAWSSVKGEISDFRQLWKNQMKGDPNKVAVEVRPLYVQPKDTAK